MQSEKKSKVFAMKTVMGNPKLLRILEDGYNSPIGSTKREQAKSVVAILKKLGSPDKSLNNLSFSVQTNKDKGDGAYTAIYKKAHDGQGGPADTMNLFSTSNPFNVPSIIKRAPEPAAGFSSMISPINSGVTANSTAAMASDEAVSNTGTGFSARKPGEGYIPWALKNYPFALNYVAKKGAQIGESIGKLNAKLIATPILASEAASEYALGKTMGSLTPRKEQTFSDTFGINALSKMWGPGKQNVPTPTPSPTSSSTPTPAIPAVSVAPVTPEEKAAAPGSMIFYDGKTYKYKNLDGTIYNGKANDGYKDMTKAVSGAAPVDTTGPDKPDNFSVIWDSLTDSEKNYYNSLPPDQQSVFRDAAIQAVTESTSGAAPVSYSGANPWAGTPNESLWNTLPQSVQQQLLSSPSKGAFADIGMANLETLKALAPGYLDELRRMHPGVPDEQLPLGAGLTGQLDALKQRLNEEYQLSELGNQYKNMISSGNTLEADLTSYIKGRDTYIKDIDKMIDDVKTSATKGMHDPASIASTNNYIDYLTVLKGRQNNRYIDLLKMSLESHDNKMKTITDAYNNAVTAYNEALSSESKMTVDRYNQVYSELASVYDMVQQGPGVAQDAALKQMQLQKAYYDNIEAAKKAEKAELPNYVKEADEYSKHFLQTTEKEKGQFIPGVDLYTQATIDLASGYSPNSLMYIIKEGLDNAKTEEQANAVKEKLNKFILDGGEDLLKAYGYQATDSSGNPVSLQESFKEAMIGPMTSSYESLIDSATKENVISLLNYLISINPKKIANKKAEFDRKAENSGISPKLSAAIWNYYVGYALPQFGESAKDVAGRKKIFAILDPNEENGASKLASSLAGYGSK